MSKRVTSYGVSAGGKPVLAHRTRFYEDFAKTFKDGEKFELSATMSTRTSRQNRLYFFWIGLICKHFSWDKGYAHWYCKNRFNLQTVLVPVLGTGEIIEVQYPGSTADLTVDEFQEFLDRMQRGFAEEGCDLPSPNDEEYPATVEQLESRADSAKGGRAAE
jgi:hypothetical protein